MPRKFWFVTLQILVACASAAGQVITTVAGTSWSFPPTPIAALEAPLGNSSGSDVILDAGGNLYITDLVNNLVMKVSPGGVLTVVAGNGVEGFSGDGGPAVNAALDFPSGLAFDRSGNLYIAE